MWMNELFSSSSSSGDPLTAARAPTPAPDSVRPVTSFVETNPPDSSRKTAPLAVITVASPPPPLLPPPTLPRQVPEVGGTYAPQLPPPCPIHPPAVRHRPEVAEPPRGRCEARH